MIRQTFNELAVSRRAGRRILLWHVTHPRQVRPMRESVRQLLAEHREVLHRLSDDD